MVNVGLASSFQALAERCFGSLSFGKLLLAPIPRRSSPALLFLLNISQALKETPNTFLVSSRELDLPSNRLPHILALIQNHALPKGKKCF
jgi:hypothetical protein